MLAPPRKCSHCNFLQGEIYRLKQPMPLGWKIFHWSWSMGTLLFVVVPIAFGAGTRLWMWALS